MAGGGMELKDEDIEPILCTTGGAFSDRDEAEDDDDDGDDDDDDEEEERAEPVMGLRCGVSGISCVKTEMLSSDKAGEPGVARTLGMTYRAPKNMRLSSSSSLSSVAG
mmetsp:Transcript_4760/g.12506  ORF Transcript_4760/g.12506 Transcript_4760/m.12506 type:complete len:108 (-) Transcript_4760:250-573(-)